LKNFNIYRDNIFKYNENFTDREYSKCSDCLEFTKLHNSCRFKISINSKTNIIESSTAQCEDDNLQLIMNIFTQLIYKMPILEANDHSVMRLENMLRDANKQPVGGVIMPENSCDYFLTPLHIIRDIFNEYCKKSGYKPIVNIYIPDKINEWKALDRDKKEKIISDKIDLFCRDKGIENYHITLIGDRRVEFAIDKDQEVSLGKLLFDMEQSLNREFGLHIEIMFTEKKDTNKKRQNR